METLVIFLPFPKRILSVDSSNGASICCGNIGQALTARKVKSFSNSARGHSQASLHQDTQTNVTLMEQEIRSALNGCHRRHSEEMVWVCCEAAALGAMTDVCLLCCSAITPRPRSPSWRRRPGSCPSGWSTTTRSNGYWARCRSRGLRVTQGLPLKRRKVSPSWTFTERCLPLYRTRLMWCILNLVVLLLWQNHNSHVYFLQQTVCFYLFLSLIL